MSEGVEVWRGSVATWECDAMGHLNVGFYVAKSMEGLIGLAAELGMPGAFSPGRARHPGRPRTAHPLHAEARPGAPLDMTGGVIEMGETDARLLLLLRHRTGEIAAASRPWSATPPPRRAGPSPGRSACRRAPRR